MLPIWREDCSEGCHFAGQWNVLKVDESWGPNTARFDDTQHSWQCRNVIGMVLAGQAVTHLDKGLPEEFSQLFDLFCRLGVMFECTSELMRDGWRKGGEVSDPCTTS